MGKLKIENGDWNAVKNKNNTKHRGEGCNTENYNPDLLRKIQGLIEAFLQNKYKCFKEQLGNESNRKSPPVDMNAPNDGADTIGSRFGPGVIGDGIGDGYAGKSNIFVGLPDKDALELSEQIEALKKEERDNNQTENNNC
jgi:hypothetical protein|tara:strand:- start:59345 stop:59764 length:420 start_codon:yes stop_codon:yes gene_type:complete